MSTPRDYLATGNRAMALSGTAMLIGIGAAYPFSHHLGIALQVIAHLSIAVAAGVFTLGYVIRLAAQHEQAQATRVGAPVSEQAGERTGERTRRAVEALRVQVPQNV